MEVVLEELRAQAKRQRETLRLPELEKMREEHSALEAEIRNALAALEALSLKSKTPYVKMTMKR